MLYLEDYLEMIEHLPQELRDRFTEMRELDLSVQNNMDDLEKRVKGLFNEWKRNPNELPITADLEFEGIKKEYYKTLEDQDEKVVLANQMYELVDRYLRRLDTELHKFKCELEADNKGITELLEKRSLELDTPITSTTSSQKENRYERYTSSRPREKRRNDSCQSAGGVTYPEKRPHLTHSLSLGESRLAQHSIGATNGNNVTLTSQLQQHTQHQQGSSIHGLSQAQHQPSITLPTSTPLNTTAPLNSTTPLNTNHHLHHSVQPSSSSSSTILTGNNTLSANITSASSTTSSSTSSSSNNSNSVANSSSAGGGGGGGGYTLVSGGAGPAIAAAASQAIAATQKMQQGRRTPSLKASYEAINNTSSGLKVNDLAIGRELAGAAQTAIQAIQHDTNKKKQKKYTHTSSSLQPTTSSSSTSTSHHHHTHSIHSHTNMSTSSSFGLSSSSSSSSGVHAQLSHDVHGGLSSLGNVVVTGGAEVQEEVLVGVASAAGGGGAVVDELVAADGEYIDTYDPNEPRYCLCNQVSYGDMVACDNEDCPSEWFHYPCVGITAPPKGKWFCPQCTSSMRRRSRKN